MNETSRAGNGLTTSFVAGGTDDEWRAGIGRPLEDAFRDFVPGNETEVDRLIGRYREYQMANHDRLTPSP